MLSAENILVYFYKKIEHDRFSGYPEASRDA